LRVSGITKTPPPCELWLIPLFRSWLWFTIRREGNLADHRDGHSDSGTRFSLTYSAGPSALRRLRPVLRPVRPVRPRRRVQPPLLQLRAARAVHEPRAMFDSQCYVHTAMCPVPSRSYSSGGAAQAVPDKETPISKNMKFDTEAQIFDIAHRYRRSICRYREIFDIGI
jgi:hypothetical protein